MYVHVLVRYIGGERGVGGGLMTSMPMRLLFSLSCVHVLVRYIGGEGGRGGLGGWGGGGG